jgi:hypothetical protein
MFGRRNEGQEELKREVLSAGLMSERFPAVSSIVVRMNYKRGRTSALLRTVNFFPGSPAFFRISCLGEGCERGGLDLTWVINSMIRRGERSSRGDVRCQNHTPETLHADVDFDVAITYA